MGSVEWIEDGSCNFTSASTFNLERGVRLLGLAQDDLTSEEVAFDQYFSDATARVANDEGWADNADAI